MAQPQGVESGSYTPEVLARRMKIAQSMLGDPTRPITHWAEGLNELAKGYFGGKMLKDAEDADSRGQRDAAMEIARLLMPGGGMPAAATGSPPAGNAEPQAASIPRPPAEIPAPAGGGAMPSPAMPPAMGAPPPAGGAPARPIQQATEGIISAVDPVEGDLVPRMNAPKALSTPERFTNAFGAFGMNGGVPGQQPAPPAGQAAVAQAMLPPGVAPPMAAGRPSPSPADSMNPLPPEQPPAARVGGAFNAATSPAPPAGDPDIRAKIVAMMQSPNALVRKRGTELGMSLATQMVSPDKPEWKVLGKDETGRETYGWVNPKTMRVTPGPDIRQPEDPNSVIGKAPLGVDPNVWRKARSEREAELSMPADHKTVSSLRKEVQDLPSYKNVAQSMPVYKAMREAVGRDTRGADLNLIYGFAKLMDPGSVVRESETAMVQNIATFPQAIQSSIKSFLTGDGKLSPEVRQALMQEASGRASAYKSMFDNDVGMYRGIAQRGRINEKDVIPDLGQVEPYNPTAAAGAKPTLEAAEALARQRGLMK